MDYSSIPHGRRRGSRQQQRPGLGHQDRQERGSPANRAGDPLMPFVLGLLSCCHLAPLPGQTQSARTER